jgi:hypothetical protein
VGAEVTLHGSHVGAGTAALEGDVGHIRRCCAGSRASTGPGDDSAGPSGWTNPLA